MKVGVIGGGIVGLVCAHELLKKGHCVELMEAERQVGGLAGSFGEKDWKWKLEKYYHHVFAGDRVALSLAKEVGCEVVFKLPRTDSYIDGKIRRLDSPVSVISFGGLSLRARLRMGAGLLVLKLIPNGQFLERFRVETFLPKLIGSEAYERIWERLLRAKFGKCICKVNMAWFWARVSKRTRALGYFEGGCDGLCKKLADSIENKGGKIVVGKKFRKSDGEKFDKVILTIPLPIAKRIVGEKLKAPELDYLWGQTLVIETRQSLMNSYWLNILEREWPFLVAVQHTNFVDNKHYGGNNLVYLGNYLMDGDAKLSASKEGLLKIYEPYIKKIGPKFDRKAIVNYWKFQNPYAQPVFPINYSKKLPLMKIDDKYFMANMSMVYPFDRGINYAVELGMAVAGEIDVE